MSRSDPTGAAPDLPPPASPLEREIVAIVARITRSSPDRITRDTDLRTALNVDSLQGLQIVAAVEKRFGITVANDEIDFYTSVGAIVEIVERLRAPVP
jgi:acyl carrier protein